MTLTLLFTLFGGLMTSLTYLFYPTLSPWWLAPLWIGYYVVFGLLYILVAFTFFLLLRDNSPDSFARYVAHRTVKRILNWVLLLLGIRVKLTGTEKLPDTPYLLVSNHRSAFDPICTVAALKQEDMVFVCKPSVLKIPLIGKMLSNLCFLAIDRENARNAVTTIKRSAELIKDVGLSVGIYPEGTRSKDGNLLPFHAGSFKIAKLAACPVAVATIRYEKRGLLPWNRRIHIHIVDVMDEAYVAESNTATMTERAEAAIRADLGL